MTWCIHFKLLFHPSTSLERKGADVHFCEDPPSRKPEKKPPSHETCPINDTSNKLPLYEATNHPAQGGWAVPAKFWINIVNQHNKKVKIFQNTSIKKITKY